MNNKVDVSKKISQIVSKTYDAIAIYTSICEDILNSEIQQVCKDIVSQKKQFVSELSAQHAKIGGKIVDENNYKELLTRPWVELVPSSSMKDKELIDHCITAEWNASDDYDDLLIKGIEVGSDLYKVATSHRSMINQSLRKLEMLNKGISVDVFH